ncbi:MAG TPA: tyrosine--tRNA ligase, partial [Candidatus Methylomirabilis sp.]|nr:tyrosine--tRNA ligase [Candidatus Methylomirabilis sp.]
MENVYPNRDAVEAALTSGRRLRVYLGVDPTGPSLHLGHAIPMRKLAELQALGHEVILLIGDFTAMIGDPTDKLATRKQLTRKEVLVNAKNYKTQAARFLRFTGVNAASVEFNSKWLAKLSFADLIEITAHFTVQQLMSRDMFRKREYWQLKCRHCHKMFFSPIQFGNMEAFESTVLTDNTATCPNCGKDTQMEKEDFLAPSLSPIYEHEFLYPIMQAYDSIAMDVDMEIGGNDQTYNMLAGRTLMKKVKNKEKYVLTTKILADPSGKKMGKSEGNMIALTDSPEEMYGKVMTWTDEMIVPGFELATDISDSEIEEIQSRILKGENPFEYKRRLAHEV